MRIEYEIVYSPVETKVALRPISDPSKVQHFGESAKSSPVSHFMQEDNKGQGQTGKARMGGASGATTDSSSGEVVPQGRGLANGFEDIGRIIRQEMWRQKLEFVPRVRVVGFCWTWLNRKVRQLKLCAFRGGICTTPIFSSERQLWIEGAHCQSDLLLHWLPGDSTAF